MIHYDLGVYLSPDIPAHVRDWRNHSSIRNWSRQTGLITDGQQKRWLESLNSGTYTYSINTFRENTELVGVCGLSHVDPVHRTAEFSIYIAPEFQGNGYSKKALKTLLIFAFNELGLNNIWGEVIENNFSLEVFKSLGFRDVGFMPERYFKCGKFVGSTFICLTKEMYNNLEWKQ